MPLFLCTANDTTDDEKPIGLLVRAISEDHAWSILQDREHKGKVIGSSYVHFEPNNFSILPIPKEGPGILMAIYEFDPMFEIDTAD